MSKLNIYLKCIICIFFFTVSGKTFGQDFQDSLRLMLHAGHLNPINTAKFSPNEKMIVTTSYDRTIRIWDSRSGHLLCVLEGHTASVTSVNFSPDSRFLLSTSNNYRPELFVWDIQNSKLIANLEGHEIVREAKYSPDGTKIVSIGGYNGNIGDDTQIKVWNAFTFDLIENLSGHERAIVSIDFSPDGKMFITTSMDHNAIIWSLETLTQIRKLESHDQQLIQGLFSPDGKYVVTTAQDNNAIIWSIQSDEPLHVLKGHKHWIDYVGFSSDGKTVITSSWKDNYAKSWDVESGSNLKVFKGKVFIYTSPRSFEKSKRNSSFIYDVSSGSAWDISTSKLLWTKKILTDNIEENCTVVFSPNGKNILVTGSEYWQMNKSQEIWDYAEVYSLLSGEILFKLKGLTMNILSNSLSSDGQMLINFRRNKNLKGKYSNCINCENSLSVYDLKSASQINTFDFIEGKSEIFIEGKGAKHVDNFLLKSDSVYSIYTAGSNDLKCNLEVEKNGIEKLKIKKSLFSPNGKYLITIGIDSSVALWNAESGQLIQNIAYQFKEVSEFIFDSNCKKLLAISKDTAFLWDINLGKVLFKLVDVKGINPSTAVYSKRGDFIILSSEYIIQGDIYIYDARSGILVRHLKAGNELDIGSLKLSTDEKYLVSTSYNDETKLWDLESGRLIQTFKGGKCALFSPDNKSLLTISNKINFWDLKSGSLNKSFDWEGEFPNVYLNEAFFVNDEYVFLFRDFDMSAPLIILNVSNGEFVKVSNSSSAGFQQGRNINLSPNGNFVVISSGDSKSLIWSLKSKRVVLEIVDFESNNWLMKLTGTPYYICTKDASKMLHYVSPSLKVIGFEQLDPVFNRPDIVMDSIGKYFGNEDRGMIEQYKKAWEKRINRLGLDKDRLSSGEIAVPNTEIINEDQIQYENKVGNVIIHIKASDAKYTLRRYNVLVNEVPIYGSDGFSISDLNTQQWERIDTISLSVGKNKIQVSVMNELGLENFKYPTYVNYTPKSNIVSKTYYVGIGVNEFKDSSHNLKYCVKDVQDLAKGFVKNNSSVETILFTNEEVTKENILALKTYLQKNTTVNDKVIISCSSHGLLDDSLNFYLATSDVDFKNPRERGLKYEELENLLDGISARQKLLLLDACNSGENEKTFIERSKGKELAELDPKKKGEELEAVNDELSTFLKMNELFVNIRNQTGSVIISAAGGMQSALEAVEVNGKEIENGAFTYSVLEFLNTQEDARVKDLKLYVEKRVEEITKGKQKPTSRQETMEVDWELFH